MAAIAILDRAASRGAIPLAPAGRSQGSEGHFLDDGAIRVAKRWSDRSEYVKGMLAGQIESPCVTRLPAVAALSAAVCGLLVTCGMAVGYGGVLFPIAAAVGLFAYRAFARWLARLRNPSSALRLLERIRRALAYEGGPGPEAS